MLQKPSLHPSSEEPIGGRLICNLEARTVGLEVSLLIDSITRVQECCVNNGTSKWQGTNMCAEPVKFFRAALIRDLESPVFKLSLVTYRTEPIRPA